MRRCIIIVSGSGLAGGQEEENWRRVEGREGGKGMERRREGGEGETRDEGEEGRGQHSKAQ